MVTVNGYGLVVVIGLRGGECRCGDCGVSVAGVRGCVWRE